MQAQEEKKKKDELSIKKPESQTNKRFLITTEVEESSEASNG